MDGGRWREITASAQSTYHGGGSLVKEETGSTREAYKAPARQPLPLSLDAEPAQEAGRPLAARGESAGGGRRRACLRLPSPAPRSLGPASLAPGSGTRSPVCCAPGQARERGREAESLGSHSGVWKGEGGRRAPCPGPPPGPRVRDWSGQPGGGPVHLGQLISFSPAFAHTSLCEGLSLHGT